MDAGQLTLCLKCRDLDRSQRFYETLGLTVVERSDTSLVMKNGNTRLALMTFLERNCLNFRGADAFAVYDAFQTAGLDPTGEAERYPAEKYQATADGSCWSTFDPDGNNVFIDTNEVELSEAGRQARISNLLNDTARELASLGASEECLRAYQEQIVQRFAKG